ncbi:hypothetical protein I7I53_06871 [Histoplasma capsulatum var. duboisii H88]|uniref:Uncharacterized protein n=1 Tax=Ajellomyces capsulatus (strain H88) TaxID=544711 RepID=A0A8A1LC74_AJEC8|nr:hypothetical protein I7I53_06871 [Histoplasma capsulatum var. duboisii H88]
MQIEAEKKWLRMSQLGRQVNGAFINLRDGTNPFPSAIVPWGSLAMWYLGVPIVCGAAMVFVQDGDYTIAIEKLEDMEFIQSISNHTSSPKIMKSHSNPQQMLNEINADHNHLYYSCAVFNYPHDDTVEKDFLQIYLFSKSFTHIPLEDISLPSNNIAYTATTKQFDIYKYIYYPLKQMLIESFVKTAN